MANQGAVVIDVIANIEEAQKNLEDLQVKLENFDDKEVDLNLDISNAEANIQKIKEGIDNLSNDAIGKASGFDGFFDTIITKMGGKITGLGTSFTSIFEIAKQGLTTIGLQLTSIMAIVGVALGVIWVIIDLCRQVIGENQELNAELQEIGAILNNLIRPVIEAIKSVVLTFLKGVIKVIKTILGWVRDIIYTLTGHDIFAGIEVSTDVVQDNANKFEVETAKTAKNTKAINKNTGGISSNLKEARKQLAGFDEMNVLNDNKSSSGGGGGMNLGGLGTPIEDTKKLGEETSKIGGIVSGVGAKAKNTYEVWKIDILNTIKAGKQLSTEQFQNIRNMENEMIHLMSKSKLTDKEKESLKQLKSVYGDLYREGALNNGQMEIYKVLTDKSIKSDKERAQKIQELTKKVNAERIAMEKNIPIEEALNQQEYTGKVYMDEKGNTLEEVAKQYGLNKDQIDKLKGALDIYNDTSIAGIDRANAFNKALKDVGGEAGLTMGEIATLNDKIQNMKGKEVEVKVNKPLGSVLTEISKTIADKIGLKKTVDVQVNAPKENILTKLGNTIINTIKKHMPSLNIETTTTTKTSTKKSGNRKGALIKYASGGIINQPGRGVPLAVGGEAGREGVIPLTDSQQMALLGEAIGKYITINASITNTMNGRVLSKELQKIQNEQNFASNRW